MEIKNLVIDGYNVKMDVINSNESGFRELFSQEYTVDGLVKFQIRILIPLLSYYGISGHSVSQQWTFIKFVNITKNTSLNIKLSSTLQNLFVHINADSRWHLITYESTSFTNRFGLSFTVDIRGSRDDKLKVLYEDDKLTDFELRGDDGSVEVHKFMLASTSPALQTMIDKDWKGQKNGYIHFEGISKATLQDFKQYIYLDTLPSTFSEQIYTLAMRYKISNLEMICIKNLVESLEAENVPEFLEYAISHKNDRLMVAILECVQHGFAKVDNIENGPEKNNGKGN